MSYRRLIICTDSAAGGTLGATATERDAVTKLLTGKGWQVWHWFQDLWLVTVPPGDVTDLLAVREAVKGVMSGPGRQVVILDGDGNGFAGQVDTRGVPWMSDNWRSDPPAEGAATPVRVTALSSI